MTSPELLDARGVEIAPGDTVIYGFGVGRSIAMAEAVVLGGCSHSYPPPGPCRCGTPSSSVSLTPSGRVRLRIVRRSYGGGEKPVVDVAPDRLVVLKPCAMGRDGSAILPPSPLPTQAEERRDELESLIALYTPKLRKTVVPDRWAERGETLADYHAWCANRLAELRKQLELDDHEQI